MFVPNCQPDFSSLFSSGFFFLLKFLSFVIAMTHAYSLVSEGVLFLLCFISELLIPCQPIFKRWDLYDTMEYSASTPH